MEPGIDTVFARLCELTADPDDPFTVRMRDVPDFSFVPRLLAGFPSAGFRHGLSVRIDAPRGRIWRDICSVVSEWGDESPLGRRGEYPFDLEIQQVDTPITGRGLFASGTFGLGVGFHCRASFSYHINRIDLHFAPWRDSLLRRMPESA